MADCASGSVYSAKSPGRLLAAQRHRLRVRGRGLGAHATLGFARRARNAEAADDDVRSSGEALAVSGGSRGDSAVSVLAAGNLFGFRAAAFSVPGLDDVGVHSVSEQDCFIVSLHGT